MSKRNLWYLGLEPLKERYTYQLSEEWMPSTFEKKNINFRSIRGGEFGGNINVGSVLDAYGRGVYSMNQCKELLKLISTGEVKNNDILYLQDFWTPGIESVFYMLDLYGLKLKVYSMLHAQSVDEYDFTYPMRNWMRGFELGIDSYMSGIFVGSSIHKHQLRSAGFKSPIHVVSLPINSEMVKLNNDKKVEKENQIIFTSRLDKEKNPFFMLKLAKEFLKRYENWSFVVTTSGNEFKSNMYNVINELEYFAEIEPRFILKSNLSKEEYYLELSKSKIQFNSSLQDYVSWTLIESTLFDCDIVYPNFRSFPEIINKNRLYKAFDIDSALQVIAGCIKAPLKHEYISEISNIGRMTEGWIMINDIQQEFNVWHENEYLKTLIW